MGRCWQDLVLLLQKQTCKVKADTEVDIFCFMSDVGFYYFAQRSQRSPLTVISSMAPSLFRHHLESLSTYWIEDSTQRWQSCTVNPDVCTFSSCVHMSLIKPLKKALGCLKKSLFVSSICNKEDSDLWDVFTRSWGGQVTQWQLLLESASQCILGQQNFLCIQTPMTKCPESASAVLRRAFNYFYTF